MLNNLMVLWSCCRCYTETFWTVVSVRSSWNKQHLLKWCRHIFKTMCVMTCIFLFSCVCFIVLWFLFIQNNKWLILLSLVYPVPWLVLVGVWSHMSRKHWPQIRWNRIRMINMSKSITQQDIGYKHWYYIQKKSKRYRFEELHGSCKGKSYKMSRKLEVIAIKAGSCLCT